MSSPASSVIRGLAVVLLGGVILGGTSSGDTVAAAAPSLPAPSPAATADGSAGAAALDAGAVVMGAPSGASVGGWTEIGRTPVVDPEGPSLADLRDLTALDDVLVAIGTIDETPEGPSHRVLLRSTDGITWLPVDVPGTDPVVTALASTADGLLAGGSEIRDGERAGSLWTSSDGLAWTAMEDIPFAEVRLIVSGDVPLVVVDDSRRPSVWVSDDGGEGWSTSRRLNDFSIARGPGGFLMWRGGGQDRTVPTRVLHSADATDFRDVELPRALTRGDDALAGVSVFALGDGWVLVPSEAKLPESIFTSDDGRSWEEKPRPVRLTEARWVADVDGEVQAFGAASPVEADPSDLVATPTGLWTWQLGEASDEPEVLDADGDDVIDRPVPFADGSFALGRDGGEDAAVTVWRYEPAAG
jgi:hypothetical protein